MSPDPLDLSVRDLLVKAVIAKALQELVIDVIEKMEPFHGCGERHADGEIICAHMQDYLLQVVRLMEDKIHSLPDSVRDARSPNRCEHEQSHADPQPQAANQL
jgi:hypothetical protein